MGNKEDILEYVDKDQLWEKYGGNLQATDHETWVAEIKEYAKWWENRHEHWANIKKDGEKKDNKDGKVKSKKSKKSEKKEEKKEDLTNYDM